jgi:hypothetical protein
MTTGPVGLSDGIHMSNGPLLQRTIDANGLLLKPSKPITAIDSEIASLAKGETNDDPGHVYTTFSGQLSPAPPPAPANGVNDNKATASSSFGFKQWEVLAYYFVSFMLPKQMSVSSADFYPTLRAPANGAAAGKLAVRVTGSGYERPCKDGAPANSCVGFIGAPTDPRSTAMLIEAPASNFTNVTGGTHYSPVLTTVWPAVCPSVWLLGDLTKYVCMSGQRISDVKCGSGGTTLKVHGKAGESVSVTAIKGDKVVVAVAKIPAAGVIQLAI